MIKYKEELHQTLEEPHQTLENLPLRMIRFADNDDVIPSLISYSPSNVPGIYEIPGAPNLYHYYGTPDEEITQSNNSDDLQKLKSIKKPLKRARKRVRTLANMLKSEYPLTSLSSLCEFNNNNASDVLILNQVHFANNAYYLMIKGVKESIDTKQSAAGINIKAGPCLFSGSHLTVLDEDEKHISLINPESELPSKKIRSISASSELSIYEYESIIRQTSLIADLAKSIPNDTAVSVTIDIPNVHYYFYIMDIFKQGLTSVEIVLEWFRIVDVRNKLVTNLFIKKLQEALSGSSHLSSINLLISNPLDKIAPFVFESVQQNKVPDFTKMIAILQDSGDHIWKILLDNFVPNNLYELGVAAYILEELRASLTKQGQPTQLGIMVENLSEWKIFYQAMILQKKIKKSY